MVSGFLSFLKVSCGVRRGTALYVVESSFDTSYNLLVTKGILLVIKFPLFISVGIFNQIQNANLKLLVIQFLCFSFFPYEYIIITILLCSFMLGHQTQNYADTGLGKLFSSHSIGYSLPYLLLQ